MNTKWIKWILVTWVNIFDRSILRAALVLSLSLFLSLVFFLSSARSQSQKKRMDLDDLVIRGELQNDDRLQILSRQKSELKNFIKFRTNYRAEILEQKWVVKKKRQW